MPFLVLLGLLSVAVLGIACNTEPAPSSPPTTYGPHAMTCKDVGRWMQRCENDEVVCFTYSINTLSCFVKPVKTQ